MDRPTISRNFSSLTLGTGKVTTNPSGEKVDVHLESWDKTDLIKRGFKNYVRNPWKQDDVSKLPLDVSFSLRSEVSLPKTYITKKGTLLLYSDHSVIGKRNGNKKPTENTESKNKLSFSFGPKPKDDIGITGKKIVPLQKEESGDNKVLRLRRERTFMEGDSLSPRETYLPRSLLPPMGSGGGGRPDDSKVDFRTVRGFSKAVLEFGDIDSDQEYYYSLIREKWQKRKSSEQRNQYSISKYRSDYTTDWINSYFQKPHYEHHSSTATPRVSAVRDRTKLVKPFQKLASPYEIRNGKYKYVFYILDDLSFRNRIL
ncbi:hypothetical protein CHS0354_014203 [Potamilus streckersoni]|uniref:Uncharacterized protein n=1 Tax=Potamilus streckersoni TaxID=2493646 RepID=A0AAE0W466_9BIVA|nr:hypothetical protein CHS0354_014203 [Potamilus streckersoni]